MTSAAMSEGRNARLTDLLAGHQSRKGCAATEYKKDAGGRRSLQTALLRARKPTWRRRKPIRSHNWHLLFLLRVLHNMYIYAAAVVACPI